MMFKLLIQEKEMFIYYSDAQKKLHLLTQELEIQYKSSAINKTFIKLTHFQFLLKKLKNCIVFRSNIFSP